MKYVIKVSPPPSEFEAWKINKRFTKNNLSVTPNLNKNRSSIWKKFTGNKDIKYVVKQSLLLEQGFICCYCQQRVEHNENTIIEHFIARENDATLMFEYDNIFACCDGGQRERTDKTIEYIPKYCGHEKSDKTLTINLLDINCESHFSYSFNFNPDEPEVLIEGESPEGEDTIQKLNLNTPKLRKLRGEAVAGIIFDENDEYISYKDANIIASQIKTRNENNQFRSFCVALEYVLTNL